MLQGFVPNCRDDQQVARASRGHIRDSYSFGHITFVFFVAKIDQFPRRTIQQTQRSEILRGVDMLIGFASQVRGNVRQNDDGKLQAFGRVDSHDPHAFCAFFGNRRFAALLRFGLLIQLFDKTTEGKAAAQLVCACEIANVIDIRENLSAGGPQGECGMGASHLED